MWRECFSTKIYWDVTPCLLTTNLTNLRVHFSSPTVYRTLGHLINLTSGDINL